jgi:hypothetical protein
VDERDRVHLRIELRAAIVTIIQRYGCVFCDHGVEHDHAESDGRYRRHDDEQQCERWISR